MSGTPVSAMRTLRDVDWASWKPRDVATLLFVLRGDENGEVLLIRKKRGLGAGKINGPGGRLEPGEAPEVAARRELFEELCVRPRGAPSFHGELRFQFADGYSMRVFVYRAQDCVGEPAETAEAIPLWTPIGKLPFEEMWADDRLWLPAVLAGSVVDGAFVFDGDALLDHSLTITPAAGAV